jgi:PAS domain S-box-containing protein
MQAGENEGEASARKEVSAERYRLLVESVTDYGIFMLDTTGRVANWNAGAQNLKGYTAAEALGMTYEHFFTPEDRANKKPATLLAKALAEGHAFDEGWRVRKDGTRFWASVVLTTIRDDSGELIGYGKVTRDLTERKKSEDQSRQFELLVKSATDYAILMLDLDGRISSWNRGAEQLKGYTEAEIIGQSMQRFYTPEDVAAGKPQELLAIARRDGHVESEGWRVRKDGTRFWADVVLSAIRDENGELIGYGKITRDLTERKATEAMTIKALQLEVANRLKSEFLANMSHELRTPLNSIIGYSELVVTDETQGLDEVGKNNLQIVLRNARHLLALINEVLDLAKIEAGHATIHSEPFDPSQTLQAVFGISRPLADAKGIALNLRIEPGVNVVVTDEMKLRQILLNLVGNAIKFTEQGSINVTLSPAGEAAWRIGVADTGIGIAPENQELVFQEFRQVDASTTRHQGGTGLGLSISRKLANLLEGTLTLYSEVGHGSLFTLELPRQLSGRFDDAQMGAPDWLADHANTAAADGRPIVLVIDDDPHVLHLLSESLKGSPYLAVTATSGESGLELARELRPAAITLDILMPKHDGWMILRRLKSDPATADIPVVLVSFLGNKGLAYQLGAAEYLEKPVERKQLLETLDRLVGKTNGVTP